MAEVKTGKSTEDVDIRGAQGQVVVEGGHLCCKGGHLTKGKEARVESVTVAQEEVAGPGRTGDDRRESREVTWFPHQAYT